MTKKVLISETLQPMVEILDLMEQYKDSKKLCVFDMNGTLIKNGLRSWGLSLGVSKPNIINRDDTLKLIEFIKSDENTSGIVLTSVGGLFPKSFYERLAEAGVDTVAMSKLDGPLTQATLSDGSSLDYGIISCAFSNKGDALAAFLEKTGIKPEIIAFVDDSRNKIDSVIKSFNENDIFENILLYCFDYCE